ncbi:MAG: hypothetical protein U0Y08_04135 [Bacteroidia bacterium]
MKNKLYLLTMLAITVFSQTAFSGPGDSLSVYPSRKHQLYFYWGWNRGFYSHSDIQFTGDNYNFTLENVVAKDRQTPLAADPYLRVDQVTIPQTDLRLGFFINDHWEISLGDDHMKYVMVQNQKVKINGQISGTGTIYDGTYADDEIYLTNDFLMYEHTDGLNYLNAEIRRSDNISRFLRLKPNAFVQVYSMAGFGAGIIYPRTNCTLMQNQRHDEFHVAGYGFAPVAGVNFIFFRHILLQGELKGGFINLPDVQTTYNDADKAKQHFWFFETLFSLGATFKIGK